MCSRDRHPEAVEYTARCSWLGAVILLKTWSCKAHCTAAASPDEKSRRSFLQNNRHKTMLRRDTRTHFVAGAGCFGVLGCVELGEKPENCLVLSSFTGIGILHRGTYSLPCKQRNIEKMRIALGPLLAYAMTRSARLRLATAPVLLSSQTRTHASHAAICNLTK